MLDILIIFLLIIFLLLMINKSLISHILTELFPIKNRVELEKKQIQLLSELGITDLSNYDIMTKKDLTNKKGYVTAYTSGTSGNMVSISHDYESFIRTQIVTGLRIFRDHISNLFTNNRIKMVFLISTKQTLTNLLATNTSFWMSFLTKITVISFDDDINSIVDKLNNIQPNIIVSYSTFLEILTMEEKLKIKPSFIVSISEPLTPIIREKLKDRFLFTQIIETYGCTECPILAVSCKYNNLHLQEDCCYIELIDENNNILPFEKGVISHKILLTNLLNTYQPIIRYVLDDSIEVLEDCPCGSVFKTIKVHGRSDDIFNLIDIYGNVKRILPISIESSIFIDLPLSGYQVIHTQQNFLLILYVSKNDCYELLNNKMANFLKSKGLSNVNYCIQKTDKIKRMNGKIRQIISLV